MTGFRAEGPDFVGIGAQKAGTTWLHDNLEIQQGYWLPPVKELHFFNRLCPAEELLGIETMGVPPIRQRYRPAFERRSIATLKWLRRFYFDPLSMSWYRRLFADTPAGTRRCGRSHPRTARWTSEGWTSPGECSSPTAGCSGSFGTRSIGSGPLSRCCTAGAAWISARPWRRDCVKNWRRQAIV